MSKYKINEEAILLIENILNFNESRGSSNYQLLTLNSFFPPKNFLEVIEQEVKLNNKTLYNIIDTFFADSKHKALFYDVLINIKMSNKVIEYVDLYNFKLRPISLEENYIPVKLIFYRLIKVICKILYYDLLSSVDLGGEYETTNKQLVSDSSITTEYLHYLIDEMISRSNSDYENNELGYLSIEFNSDLTEEFLGKELVTELLNCTINDTYSSLKVKSSKEIVELLKDIFYIFLQNIYYTQIIESGKNDVIEEVNFNTLKTYRWLLSSKKLTVLFQSLKKENYILDSTNFKDFQKCFNDIELSSLNSLYEFNNLSDSELIFLIRNLMDYGLIAKDRNFSWLRFMRTFKTSSSKNTLKTLKSRLEKKDEDDSVISLKKRNAILSIINSVL